MFVISNLILAFAVEKLASEFVSSFMFSLPFFTRLNGLGVNEFKYSSMESFKIDNGLEFNSSFFVSSFFACPLYKSSAAFNKSSIL